MRRFAGVAICVVSLFVALSSANSPASCSARGGSAAGGILITEVDPFNEGFSMVNFGEGAVDLSGYTVTDGEGTLAFLSGISMAPGCRLTVCKTAGRGWFCSRDDTLEFPSEHIGKKGRFILADAGDELALAFGGKTVDSMCYGSSEGARGWSGNPAPIGPGTYLKRISMADTDTADDWIATRPGWTGLSHSGSPLFDAEVEPFSFPESRGAPVYAALSSANESVDMSVYLLTCPNVFALLCVLEDRGVEVRVLAEGAPLGVGTSDELSLLRALADRGGDVHIINAPGCDARRFGYAHAKYAVVDSATVIVTSENWTSGNMGYGEGNRGWGAVISSRGYAEYMRFVFENDFSTEWGDVSPLGEAYPNLRPYADELVYDAPEYEPTSYPATVVPVLSPDDSKEAMRALMSSATERIYAEEMDLGGTMSSPFGDTPISWMSAAEGRGADARLILDSSGEGASSVVSTINETTGIKAIAESGGKGYAMIHNKGVIADDSVWIGSVNWTENSFSRNREAAAIITSPQISDFFVDMFDEDFGVNIHTVREDGLRMTAQVMDSSSGHVVVLRAVGPGGYSYRWDSGNGEVRVTSIPAVVFEALPGSHTAKVSLVGTGISDSVEYSVPDAEPGQTWLIYAAVTMLALSGAVVAALRDGGSMIGRRGERPRR